MSEDFPIPRLPAEAGAPGEPDAGEAAPPDDAGEAMSLPDPGPPDAANEPSGDQGDANPAEPGEPSADAQDLNPANEASADTAGQPDAGEPGADEMALPALAEPLAADADFPQDAQEAGSDPTVSPEPAPDDGIPGDQWTRQMSAWELMSGTVPNSGGNGGGDDPGGTPGQTGGSGADPSLHEAITQLSTRFDSMEVMLGRIFEHLTSGMDADTQNLKWGP